MIERSNSNSKYVQQLSRNNTQLTNDMKKFLPGRPLLSTSQQQQQQPIVSIVKPVISNVFLNNNNNNNVPPPNSAGGSSVGPNSKRNLNRSSVIRSHTDRSPTALLSPVLYHQQQIASNQQQPPSVDKSPNLLLSREKTSLSNYFTNIMNPNSGKKIKQQQQQQTSPPQIFNSTITNNLIGKINSQSRNELSSSLSSNNMFANKQPKQQQQSSSFNYKYNNLGMQQLINSDMITTGVSLKSAAILRQQQQQKGSNDTINLNRNDSTIITQYNHDNAVDDSEIDIDGGGNVYNGLPSSRSNNINNKYSINRKLIKSKTIQEKSKQQPITAYQPLMINNSKRPQQQIDEDTLIQTKIPFDESLNFDNEELIKYRNNQAAAAAAAARNSRSSFKETSAKIYGSMIVPSQPPQKSSTMTVKRHESAKSYISRDINDSYAYNDVKKYIDENDLMPPDRAEFIKLWIKDVNMCLKELEQTVT